MSWTKAELRARSDYKITSPLDMLRNSREGTRVSR